MLQIERYAAKALSTGAMPSVEKKYVETTQEDGVRMLHIHTPPDAKNSRTMLFFQFCEHHTFIF